MVCNQGLAKAREIGAEYVLIINNDTEFESDFLETLLLSLNATQAAALSPLIVFLRDSRLVWFAGGAIRAVTGFTNSHWWFEKNMRHVPNVAYRSQFMSGCCFIAPMATFDMVGEFDEQFFVYWEDCDWSQRANRLAVPLWIDPRITLGHHGSLSTGGRKSSFSLVQNHKNHILFVKKHYGIAIAWAVVPLVITKTLFRLLRRDLTLTECRWKLKGMIMGLRQAS